jgi:hypothetical protein
MRIGQRVEIIDGVLMGVLYAGFALAFLAMLVLGAIFDRPIK